LRRRRLGGLAQTTLCGICCDFLDFSIAAAIVVAGLAICFPGSGG
jgi:hypothetical protein